MSPSEAKKMTIPGAIFHLQTDEQIKADTSGDSRRNLLEWHRKRKQAMAEERKRILSERANEDQGD